MASKPVRVPESEKRRLDERKLVESEPYGSVIKRLLDATEDDAPTGVED